MKTMVILQLAWLVALPVAAATKTDEGAFYPKVRAYVLGAATEFHQIPAKRKAQLERLTSYVEARMKAGKPISATFICTRNSRRSHLAQVWAQIAAAYYSIPRVTAYSGGTGCTAFNPRAVAACRRAGLKVTKTTEGENPIYHVRYGRTHPPVTNFSKVYNHAPNPSKDFCAIMTCANADKACPNVAGASARIAIPFVDPKAFDGTDLESAKYDERCRQICREMLYVFSAVGK